MGILSCELMLGSANQGMHFWINFYYKLVSKSGYYSPIKVRLAVKRAIFWDCISLKGISK